MSSAPIAISVCVCTYKRPRPLDHLLGRLAGLRTNGQFSYTVTVVDNDSSRSAETVVLLHEQKEIIPISYHNEPRQNISHARNMAVKNAGGDFIAFIDDDEFPEDTWLQDLYKTMLATKADGVLGPVKPHFEVDPPRWIIRSGVLERPSFATGTVLNARHTRTGNVMLKKSLFAGEMIPFDPIFGRTGGEDVEFFKRMIERGHIFVWCNEACVYETVPPERYKRTYFLRRALLRGVGEARLPSSSRMGVIKSLIACFLYTSALPILLLTSHHLFMKYLIKNCDHIGKLFALCGVDVLRERNF
jgi:succinoglycan biosynthesis protein ExoM